MMTELEEKEEKNVNRFNDLSGRVNTILFSFLSLLEPEFVVISSPPSPCKDTLNVCS